MPSKYADVDECATKQCGDDSLCQNYHGGYDCECNAIGYYKVNNKGACKCKVLNTFKIGGGFLKDIAQKNSFCFILNLLNLSNVSMEKNYDCFKNTNSFQR